MAYKKGDRVVYIGKDSPHLINYKGVVINAGHSNLRVFWDGFGSKGVYEYNVRHIDALEQLNLSENDRKILRELNASRG